MTKKRKRQAAQAAWTPEHETFKSIVVCESLKRALPDASENDLDWLLGTREAHSFVLKMNQDEAILTTLITTLQSFYQTAQGRHADILSVVNRRMVELETQKCSFTWLTLNIDIPVPPKHLLPPNFGMKLQNSSSPSPDGLIVTEFVQPALNQISPAEQSNAIHLGDIITMFRPDGSNQVTAGHVAVRNNINMFVNLSVLRMFGAPSLPAPSSVKVRVRRLDDASMQAKIIAEAAALTPERVAFISSSPLLTSYARATHPKRGEDTLWLLNRDSVANIIVAPLERHNELESLFATKNVALTGAQGVLTETWTAPLPKMYDLFTVTELVQKYIDRGEVGRGRNKTSLKTAKQVVNVIMVELRKGGLCSS